MDTDSIPKNRSYMFDGVENSCDGLDDGITMFNLKNHAVTDTVEYWSAPPDNSSFRGNQASYFIKSFCDILHRFDFPLPEL